MSNKDTKLFKIKKGKKGKKRKMTLLKKRRDNKKIGKKEKKKQNINSIKIKYKSSKTKKNNYVKNKLDKKKLDKKKNNKKQVLKGGESQGKETDICSRDINDLLTTTKKIYTYNNSGADGKDFTAQAVDLGNSSSKGWGSNPGPPPDPSNCIIC